MLAKWHLSKIQFRRGNVGRFRLSVAYVWVCDVVSGVSLAAFSPVAGCT